ncbi:MAG: hypothetical protein M3540_11810 [Actinomycetota bacterium]|nr:hypothetical protein [Actinomycetota bacterium]
MLSELGMLAGYATGIVPYLRDRLDVARCRELIARGRAQRDDTFLVLLERAVFRNPTSPYLPLLQHAGIEHGDVAQLVRRDGVESALADLYDAGVRLAIDEWKGRQPVRRNGFELPFRHEAAVNPLVAGRFETVSGGSSGEPRSVLVNFPFLTQLTMYHGAFLDAFGVGERPTALWYPVPPSVAGLTNVLPNLKLGRPIARWFTQIPVTQRPGVARRMALTGGAYLAGRIAGAGFRYPEHTPADLALRVARWAHRTGEAGTPGLLQCTPSSGVRVCRAARDAGLDLAGTIFRFGGEALTAGKAEAVAESGATAGCQYFIEGGQPGIACADPVAPGDVHLAEDSFALIRRPGENGAGHSQALVLTSVSPSTPKVLLNVEIGDEAVVVERDCGCSTGELGLRRHLHTIRSYELFTSEGMSIRGVELAALVDDVLPGRFGGHATDYQFSEEEQGELSRVRLLVSPAVGAIDERAVVEAVYGYLAAQGRSEAMMSDVWRGAGTLEVVRARPHVTSASKTPPLYRLRG